ncbi:hypothetical protein TNCV_2540051 [Trichonephila clavipes]|nr:hypothetical protein TNCV_2540051 [Trichonephila clavipes]
MQSDWSQVLFTDETQFSLECDTRYGLVQKEWGTPNSPVFVQEISFYRLGGLMVGSGISLAGRTELLVIGNGNLAAQRDCLVRGFLTEDRKMNERKINLKLCFKLSKTPEETCAILVCVYEDQALFMKFVYEWFTRFREGKDRQLTVCMIADEL